MAYDIRAYLALLAFVPIALAVIATTPKAKATGAILGIYIGGLLFLPQKAAFDAPMLPPIDKDGLAALMSLVGVVFLSSAKLRAARPFRGIDLFFVLLLLANVGTVYTNPDSLYWGEDRYDDSGFRWSKLVTLSGLRPYDILSMTINDLLRVFAPFLLGRVLVRSPRDVETLFRAVAIGCLVYVPFMLVEMRMSPRFHVWVYGYFGTALAHLIRGGGYKPTVFYGGLATAMLLVAGVCSAAILYRQRLRIWGFGALGPLILLWVMLPLSRNAAATVYSLVAVPVILTSRGRLGSRLAIPLAACVLLYPTIRSSGTLDTDGLIQWISQFSTERAGSLQFRFVNEDTLLERALIRPWFGWGGYGRSRIFNEYGRNITVADGEWIILLGGRGIMGLVSVAGLMVGPVLLAWRRLPKLPKAEDRRPIDALCMLVVFNAIDLLPNAAFTSLPYVFAGALAGVSQGILVDLAAARGARRR